MVRFTFEWAARWLPVSRRPCASEFCRVRSVPSLKKKKKFRQFFTGAPAATEGSKNKRQFPLIVCSLEDGDRAGRGQKWACSLYGMKIGVYPRVAAAAAAKSLQSCPTLCDPIDGSPPGSPVPEIFQARTLEWVSISFSSASKWKVKVKSLSQVRL